MLKSRRGSLLIWFLCLLFVLAILGVYGVNWWLQRDLGMHIPKPPPPPSPPPPPKSAQLAEPESAPALPPQLPERLSIEDLPKDAEIIRKTRVMSGGGYTESIFFYNNQEIARRKEGVRGKILEQSGEIPDGPVKFMDTYTKTTGHEYYRNGDRHGESITYYPDGAVKNEAYYRYGVLVREREFYPEGILRFEVDYSNAREYGPHKDNREIGIGKLYYPDGTIKYEWHVVRQERVGYKKSYNQDGRLRATVYLNEWGDVIRESYPGKESKLLENQ